MKIKIAIFIIIVAVVAVVVGTSLTSKEGNAKMVMLQKARTQMKQVKAFKFMAKANTTLPDVLYDFKSAYRRRDAKFFGNLNKFSAKERKHLREVFGKNSNSATSSCIERLYAIRWKEGAEQNMDFLAIEWRKDKQGNRYLYLLPNASDKS